MSPEQNVKVVLKYFDGCNTGDLDVLMSTLAPDVVHYFLPGFQQPVRGAEHLARYWRKYHQVLKPVWRVDHTIANASEVVSEWSCSYIPKGKDCRTMCRGSEWYVMKSGLIAEVRAYYQTDENRDCELTGFPYQERGYLQKAR
jgi:ketosteroid isomerase-like protein